MLTRYNPFKLTAFARLFDLRPFDGRGERFFNPAVDLVEKDDHFLLTADLPGVKQEDIELTVKDGVLSLSGKREELTEEERDGAIYRERRAGSFTRTVKLGDVVDAEAIEAKFEGGVLTVTLPKRPEVKPKEIAVKINN